MNNKIVKVEREIATDGTSSLERVLARPKYHRLPEAEALCNTCGHTYSRHSYKGSAVYMCVGYSCDCRKFE